jgi:hypothetical protein
MSERDAYVARMKAKLDEWKADIEKLEAKAAAAQADVKLRYGKQLTELRVKRDAAAGKLGELQRASAGAWESLRAGVDAAWNDMAKAVKEAVGRFK